MPNANINMAKFRLTAEDFVCFSHNLLIFVFSFLFFHLSTASSSPIFFLHFIVTAYRIRHLAFCRSSTRIYEALNIELRLLNCCTLSILAKFIDCCCLHEIELFDCCGALTWKAVNWTINAHDKIDTFFKIRHFSPGDSFTFSLIETVSSVLRSGGYTHFV